MRIEPVGFRVLVKVEREKKKKTSTIVIPESVKDREVKGGFVGTVVALGPTAFQAFDEGKPWVKIGDKVIFRQYAGLDNDALTLVDSGADREKGDILRLINDEDVFGILHD